MSDKRSATRHSYLSLVVGTLCLMYALDLDYWHGVALSMGVALTALAITIWWGIDQ